MRRIKVVGLKAIKRCLSVPFLPFAPKRISFLLILDVVVNDPFQ